MKRYLIFTPTDCSEGQPRKKQREAARKLCGKTISRKTIETIAEERFEAGTFGVEIQKQIKNPIVLWDKIAGKRGTK